MTELCPCCSGNTYANCCKRFHDGALPDTALQLMRSRYTAYAKFLADYIMLTTDVDNPTYQQNREVWKRDILAFSMSTHFNKLTILSFEDGQTEAFVTFKVDLTQAGQATGYTEKSRFLKKENRWLYSSGKIVG